MSAPQDADRAGAAAAELVEVVDEQGRVLEVLTRAQMRARRARHRCTYVAVVRSTGAVVVHRRADWKDVHPGAWDLAFGGVCDVGEDWLPSARRELAEEAGVTGAELVDLGPVSWSAPDGSTSLLGRVFVALWDGPLDPADGEVTALDEVPLPGLATWAATTPTVPDSVELVPPPLLAWWQDGEAASRSATGPGRH